MVGNVESEHVLAWCAIEDKPTKVTPYKGPNVYHRLAILEAGQDGVVCGRKSDVRNEPDAQPSARVSADCPGFLSYLVDMLRLLIEWNSAVLLEEFAGLFWQVSLVEFFGRRYV